ncbi:MAG: DUF4998 domain-containing protein [Bacteroidales bacterium]|jgi:hypothetical protein|nr:DUF4998 domain-containing protein [Bacteroidales bacterium]
MKIKMKSRVKKCAGLLPVFMTVCLLWTCNKMYDNIEQYTGEEVFPAKFDTIFGRIGYHRVEIDLVKKGRIPASQIRMGKAKRTVIEYNNAANHDTIVIIDSVCSWVNIQKLTTPKMYRFRIYTLGDYEDKSVPVEISLMPYSDADRQYLSVPDPKIAVYPSMAVVSWSEGWMTTFSQFVSLNYRYTNKKFQTCEGAAAGVVPSFVMLDLPIGRATPVNLAYKVIPMVDGKPILDTLSMSAQLSVTTTSGSDAFIPKESAVLVANGVTTFTLAGATVVDKLTFPVHITSMADLEYFPHLRELDLTGGSGILLPGGGTLPLPVTPYLSDNSSYSSSVGGGTWTPVIRRIDNTTLAGAASLYKLLNAGVLQKVYYAPNSMGLDEGLAPFVAKGIVELVNMPGEVPLPNQFLLGDTRVQSLNWEIAVQQNPADAPSPPSGVTFAHTMKMTVPSTAPHPTLVFCLPVEYRWNLSEYRYLKFRVYRPNTPAHQAAHANFNLIWPRFMNHLWTSQDANRIANSYGQGYWALTATAIGYDAWTDVTVDMTQSQNGVATGASQYNRIIAINIGEETTTAPSAALVYYFADIRICKNNE